MIYDRENESFLSPRRPDIKVEASRKYPNLDPFDQDQLARLAPREGRAALEHVESNSGLCLSIPLHIQMGVYIKGSHVEPRK